MRSSTDTAQSTPLSHGDRTDPNAFLTSRGDGQRTQRVVRAAVVRGMVLAAFAWAVKVGSGGSGGAGRGERLALAPATRMPTRRIAGTFNARG
jgi:hypothetical protein